MPATSARLLQSAQLALLFLANTAQPSPFTHPTVGLVERAVDDGFTPHNPPLHWVALGDSYTAGPGAGDAWDEHPDLNYCYRSKGAYPVQLTGDFPFHGGAYYQFIACTGAKTGDVLDEQLDLIIAEPHPDFVVLTLGGNDIGFSDIIKACLVKPYGPYSADCDQTLADSRTRMNSNDLKDKMFRVYEGIFEKMPADYHYQVYHILYSKFFNAETQWCNDQTFGQFPGYRPPLTTDLRRKLNRLAEDFNSRLQDIAWKYLESKQPPDRPHAPGWVINRIFTLNPEQLSSGSHSYGLFDGHRFCEPNVRDPAFNDESIWFFGFATNDASQKVGASHFSNINTQSCQKDPKYQGDLAFSYSCDYARYFASPGAHKDIKVVAPETIVKSFHPRTVGHGAIKGMFTNTLIQLRPREHTQCASPPSRQEVLNRGVNVTVGTGTPATPKETCSIAQTSLKPTSSSKAGSSPPTSNPTPSPPYATGTCHILVKEYEDCSEDSKNLYAVVNMEDNARNDIGHTEVDPSKNPIGNPINDGGPYAFKSKLHNLLVIKGEHKNDYVQFNLGSLSWTSRTLSGPAYCHNGGWDPKGGPNCMGSTRTNTMNRIDCWFPC